ncbi:Phosphotransferase enzyme [Ceratobasidium sp. 392]|nr:Phosphotransferase enzyme [Ceratobasidium sp. 392]
MAARYVRFNVEALQQCAATAVGATRCTKMAKEHEGSYNKVFLLQFDNNTEVVAKIPTQLIPPFYTTASEVATMDFARSVLRLPVPQVLTWSARADSTPVGVEFIIMNRCEGTELRKRWDNMTGEDASSVIDQVLQAEHKFGKYKFSQIGSIYYKEDVEPALRERRLYADGFPDDDESERFRIGPSTEWALWRGGRARLEVDRGPWPDVQSYVRGVVKIHQAWLASCARPYRVNVPPRTLDDMDPCAHSRLLEKLTTLCPGLLPPLDLCAHVLWHKDLHAKNILVTKSSPPSITLIDWQSTSVGPFFQQATFALFAQYHGDSRIDLFNGAHLPNNFDGLAWHEKIYLKHQRRLALRHLYYSMHVEPSSLNAQNWSRLVPLRAAIDEAGRTWDLGLGTLREHLLSLASVWGTETPCPFAVGRAKREMHEQEQARIRTYQEYAKKLYRHLEAEGDGWIPKERYEDACAMNEEQRLNWDENGARGPYPIKDGAPSCDSAVSCVLAPVVAPQLLAGDESRGLRMKIWMKRPFIIWGSGSDSEDPERAVLLPSDQVKLTILEAEKHRDSHHRQSQVLEYVLQTLVVLQIINGAVISALSAVDLSSNVPTIVLGALASILGGVIAAFKSNKTQQREQLVYFALDTFIRKWRDWAYDLERDSNPHWDGRREDLNEANFNAAYDQIQRYELDSDRNLVNFAYAVTANAPEVVGHGMPLAIGGIGGVASSPLVLTPPRRAPAPLSPVH